MARKGASLIFEHVMLFMIGVVIFIACFSIFRSYELYFTDSIMREQLEDVNEMIVSNLITFSQRPDVNATIRMSVPEIVGNEYYTIRLRQEGLNLTTLVTGTRSFSPLSALNRTFALSGGFSTLHGSEFLIYKRGDQIIIG